MALAAWAVAAAQAQPAKPAGQEAGGPIAMIRVACADEAMNAEITVNGQFKGDCPADIPVAAGTIQLRVVKKVDAMRESVFEQEFRIVAGGIRRVDVALSEPRFTPEGARLDAERRQREQAEAARVAAEKAKRDEQERQAADARNRAAVEGTVAALLPELHVTGDPNCPFCPAPIAAAGPPSMATPNAPNALLQGWMERLRSETSAYMANKSTAFVVPASAAPLPCDGAQAAMLKLAGLVGTQSAPDMLHYVHDARVWPVTATCVEGQLDGPLEFWASAVEVHSDIKTYTLALPKLVRLQTQMSAGKPHGEVFMASRVGGSTMKYADPAVDAHAKAQNSPGRRSYHMAYSLYTINPAGKGNDAVAGITLMFHEDASLQSALEGPMTTFVSKLADGRSETSSYEGMRQSTRSYTKNGQQHGPMTIYGYTKRLGAFIPDLKVPTTVHCYRNGKQVALNPCTVE